MNKLFINTVFLCLFFGLRATSQQIPATTTPFAAGIWVEVLEIAKITNLPLNKQVLLATHFTKRDSLKLAALLSNDNNKNLVSIDSIYSVSMAGILTTDQLKKWMTHKIYQRVALCGAESDEKKASYYTEDLLSKLDSVKPLTDVQKNKVRNSFNRFIKIDNNLGYGDHFMTALRSVTKDTGYFAYLYKTEINRMGATNTSRDVLEYYNRYKLTRSGTDEVGKKIQERAYCRATIFYTLPNGSRYKDSLTAHTEKFYDALIISALYKDGNFPHPTQFATAIKNRQKLKIDDNLVDSLIKIAVSLEQSWSAYEVKNPLGKFDPKPYEAAYLPKMLSDDQYMKLLEYQYETQAGEWAIGDWDELKQRNLTDGLDSAYTIKEITKFNSSRLALQARYANDKPMMYAQIKALDANKPAASKKLSAARAVDTPDKIKQKAIELQLKW